MRLRKTHEESCNGGEFSPGNCDCRWGWPWGLDGPPRPEPMECGHNAVMHQIDGDDGPCLACYAESK